MLIYSKLLSLLFVCLFMVGCDQSTAISGADHSMQSQPSISVTLNAPFLLKVDQIAQIKPENIQVKFVNVEEDSRCPPEAQCVWQGQVKLKINVINQGQNLGDFELISRVGQRDLAIQTFAGYSIEVIDIDPPPIPHQRINIDDYIATFYLTKI